LRRSAKRNWLPQAATTAGSGNPKTNMWAECTVNAGRY